MLRADAHRFEREIGQLYRDKARLLEDLVASGADLAASHKRAQGLEADVEHVSDDGKWSIM